jgi:hypothetical protein
MTTLIEGKHTGEFILSEGNGTISREVVTIIANSGALVDGTVLGKITASGKYAPYNNAHSDGTDLAAGILYGNLPASTADQKAVAFVRQCEVMSSALTGLDTPGTADLAALSVIVRT